MKKLFVLTSIFLLTACGGSSSSSQESFGVSDDSLAADPVVRQEAYFEIAEKLIESYLSDLTSEMSWELVWEEVPDGNAQVKGTGTFNENGEYIEKSTIFRITRLEGSDNWVVKDPIEFTNSSGQLQKEFDEVVENKYSKILKVFENQPEVISAGMIPVENVSYESYQMVIVTAFENPTDTEFQISYRVDYTTFQPLGSCSEIEETKEDFRTAIGVLLPNQITQVSYKSTPTVGVSCVEKVVKKATVTLISVDGYTKAEAEGRLQ